MTTPIIRALRRALPASTLTYLVEPQAAAVVQGNPHLNSVIVAPLRSGLARWQDDVALAIRLRRERFDTVIDFHGGPRSSWLALASGAPERIGYTVKGRGWMYSTRVARPREHFDRHSVLNQWDLIESLIPDTPPPTPASDPVEMAEDAAAAALVSARLRALDIAYGAELIVIHVGAGNEFRRWPETAFAEVAVALTAAAPNRRIILTTGPAQSDRAQAVRQIAVKQGANANAVAVACDLNLAEVRSLMGRAALFIGGDSGPAHIASTTAIPMVVIFGPTNDVVWGPWRNPALVTEIVDAGQLPCRPCDQRTCEPGDFRCLRGIGAATVVAAAERALKRGRNAELGQELEFGRHGRE